MNEKGRRAEDMTEIAVMLSVRPEWSDLILLGEKKVECRKSWPKKIKPPFRVYQYETAASGGAGAVVAEWTCKMICAVLTYPEYFNKYPLFHEKAIREARMTDDEVESYGKGRTVGGLVISDMKVYDAPRPLSDFGLERPPQSWCYVKKKDV